MTNIHFLDIGDVRKARRGWKEDNYGEKIKELKRPTTTKYKLLRLYYRVHPFTSISNEVNKLVQRDELQDKIIGHLDDLEEVVDELQNDLEEWKDVRGEVE